MITISNFKDILTSKTGGKPLGKIPNFYSMLYQAMLEMKSKTDIPSAIRTVQLTNPIYTNVNDYAIPSDVTLGGIINLRPIEEDNSFYDYNRGNQRQLGIEKKYGVQNKYATKHNNGIQYLFIDTNTTLPVVINDCESLTSNGTVALYGSSTNLQLDRLQKVSGGASISFANGASSSNGITITGLTAVDLSSQNDMLANVYIPTITNLSGIQLVLGQSASAYYTGAVSTDFFGNALKVGWNFIRIPKTSFTVGLGSPTWTNVTYARVELIGTFTVATEGWRVDSLLAQVGALYEMDYYSNLQFQSVTGTRLDKPSQDADYILLQDDELALFLGYFIEIMAVDLKQLGAGIDVQAYGGARLVDATLQFKIKYPSLRQLAQQTYGYKPYIT